MAVREKEGGGSGAVSWRRMCEARGHRLQPRAAALVAARPWNLIGVFSTRIDIPRHITKGSRRRIWTVSSAEVDGKT